MGRQVHAEWGWLAAGGATELDWWLYTVSWSPSPPLCLHNGHLGTHQHKHWDTYTWIQCTQILHSHSSEDTHRHKTTKLPHAHLHCVCTAPLYSFNIHLHVNTNVRMWTDTWTRQGLCTEAGMRDWWYCLLSLSLSHLEKQCSHLCYISHTANRTKHRLHSSVQRSSFIRGNI